MLNWKPKTFFQEFLMSDRPRNPSQPAKTKEMVKHERSRRMRKANKELEPFGMWFSFGGRGRLYISRGCDMLACSRKKSKAIMSMEHSGIVCRLIDYVLDGVE